LAVAEPFVAVVSVAIGDDEVAAPAATPEPLAPNSAPPFPPSARLLAVALSDPVVLLTAAATAEALPPTAAMPVPLAYPPPPPDASTWLTFTGRAPVSDSFE
jgi:hypothetical protein